VDARKWKNELHDDPLVGRRVRLVPIEAKYRRFLYELTIDERIAFRWRYGGDIPDLETFERDLWKGVLCQFVVLLNSQDPAGIVVADHPDLNWGFAYIGGAFMPELHRRSVAIEAQQLFISYLFRNWPFRKLYMEVPEYNMSQYKSGIGGIAKEEARLREYTYLGGRFWDRSIVALYRSDFLGLPTNGSNGKKREIER
jgi:RimJ/RimL family protein N-acetyltransferase